MKHRTDAKAVVGELRPLLLDLVVLSLQTKQAHWNVTGPLFDPLHGLFDRMTDQHREWYDTVAERARALGEPAEARLVALAKESKVEELPDGEIPGDRAVHLLLARIEGLVSRTREGLGRLGDLDPVTQDMVIGVVEGLEKQAWMLRVQKG